MDIIDQNASEIDKFDTASNMGDNDNDNITKLISNKLTTDDFGSASYLSMARCRARRMLKAVFLNLDNYKVDEEDLIKSASWLEKKVFQHMCDVEVDEEETAAIREGRVARNFNRYLFCITLLTFTLQVSNLNIS